MAQVSFMLLGVVDTIMLGRLGVQELAGATLGHVWLYSSMMFSFGFIFGTDPIITQAHGRGDGGRIARSLQRALVITCTLFLPLAGLWLITEPVLLFLKQDPELAIIARRYVWIQIPSIIPALAYFAFRQYLLGRGIVRPPMYISFVAVGLNILFNWVFIFGNLGVPAMGVEGAGLATALTRFMNLFLIIGVIRLLKLHHGAWVPWSRRTFRWSAFKEIVHFGIPVSFQISLEMWAFQISTLLAGKLGAIPLAAHTVSLNIASVVFMVPLGLSMATVTRVGNLIGEGKQEIAQRVAWISLGLGAVIMSIAAVSLMLFRYGLPKLYTPDLSVIEIAAGILPIAAAFQLFDGIQVVGGGILRGMGHTRPAAIFNFVGYYILALPLGAYLAYRKGFGVDGIWWGLCLGLAVISILLLYWVKNRGPAHVEP
ncbi:MAG: MATE family efflux transporter, partial [Candidatus Eisenbacteria bacterium]|nr:MATE family efflux transporter [Candidatus Eisenbacteria bacterium]